VSEKQTPEEWAIEQMKKAIQEYEALRKMHPTKPIAQVLGDILADLYGVERKLSYLLQPEVVAPLATPKDAKRSIAEIRDELRGIMRRMGWRKPF